MNNEMGEMVRQALFSRVCLAPYGAEGENDLAGLAGRERLER